MTLKSVPYAGRKIVHDKTGNEYTFEEEIQVKMGNLWVAHCSYRSAEYKKFARDFSDFMSSFSLSPEVLPEPKSK